jgi:ArsR family transcriptional regulator, zinc-responsive transcriptional repressor
MHRVDDRNGSYESAASLLKALAHPLRLEILTALQDGPLCVHDLVERTGANQPLVSQHLRILRSAEVLVGRRRGREVAYELADQHVSHIVLDAIEHTGIEGIRHEHHLHPPH